MYRTTMRALFAFAVFKTHLTDMPAAASDFHTDDITIIKDINPVIVVVALCLVVHNHITP